MLDSSRYSGKPLLRLIELYVLSAIGELSLSDQQSLEKMAPKLTEIYGGGGGWHAAIAAAANLPTDASVEIREIWNRNLRIALSNNLKLTPQAFAEMIVDDNFSRQM